MFGMTRGEIGLVAFIFLLIYGAIILPRLAQRIGGSKPPPGA